MNPHILLVGDFTWPWYQEACAQALETLGCQVSRFTWFDTFKKWIPNATEPVYHSLIHKVQHHIQYGPMIHRINRRLIRCAQQQHPDIIWFYNVQLITVRTLKILRQLLPNALFCQYANDNPFSSRPRFWRHYLKSIPYFDMHCGYRHADLKQYHTYGCKHTHLLRSYFIPENDRPVTQDAVPESFHCDVVFAGHYENDGRVAMLEAICHAGFDLRLYGGGWNAALANLNPDSPLRQFYPIHPATGMAYQYAICGAKVALCFLSTLNQDTYTRRNFQIPAMRVAMLSQYTSDLSELFESDVEASFFTNQQELLEKLHKLVHDDSLRARIAEQGHQKVYAQGHDVMSRMQQWLTAVDALRATVYKECI